MVSVNVRVSDTVSTLSAGVAVVSVNVRVSDTVWTIPV